MATDVRILGKRRRGFNNDGAVEGPSKRTSTPAAVNTSTLFERFDKFVAASLSLRGAIVFERQFEAEASSEIYTEIRKRHADQFSEVLSNVVEMTSSFAESHQNLIVEMACNTELLADSGKAIDITCRHLDDFKNAPRSTLLLNAIRAFPHLPKGNRLNTALIFSEALAKGYFGEEHIDALKSVHLSERGEPSKVKTYFGHLLKELEPQAIAIPSSAGDKLKRSPLERLPPELLQDILYRSVQDDLRQGGTRGFGGASETIRGIGLASRTLNASADEAGLLALRSSAYEVRIDVIKRYADFMKASQAVIDAEAVESLDENSPDFTGKLRTLSTSSGEVIGDIKFLTEKEQSLLVSEFCRHSNAPQIAHLMIAASEHADDFLPKPRSEMFAKLIQLLPNAPDSLNLKRGCQQLAKAQLAGHLEQQHYDSLKICDVANINNLINYIDDLGKNPDEAVKIPIASKNVTVTAVDQAGRGLLSRLDSRVPGDRDRSSLSI